MYPADPRLFVDAVHMTQAGIKLHAWLVFQQLVPMLKRMLDDGRLPLVDPGGRTAHPGQSGGQYQVVPIAPLRETCRAAAPAHQ